MSRPTVSSPVHYLATTCAATALALVVMAGASEAQIVALDVPTPLEGNQDFGGELGMDFDVTAFDVEVSRLGFFDSLQDGIQGASTSIHVELWSRDNGGTPDNPFDDAGISVLASQTFTMGDDGELVGGSRFKDITPLTLSPGSYSIVAGGLAGVDPLWNFAISGNASDLSTINTGGGNVEFVGAGRFGAQFTPGVFPGGVDGGPANRYHAGNFVYTPTVDFDTALKVEVDRDTGEVSLINFTGQQATILSYSIRSEGGALDREAWTSITQNYDADAPLPNGGSVDPDDTWVELTDPASHTDLSEIEIGGAGPLDGATLANSQTVSLGAGAWIKSPSEDLVFTYLLSSGEVVDGLVTYTGTTQTEAYQFGDLNFDGDPFGLGDFTGVMLPNLISQLPSELSNAEAYQMGDLNGDLRVDDQDFRIFKEGFVSQGGNPAALAGLPVPEPSTMFGLLVAVACVGVAGIGRSGRGIANGAAALLVLTVLVAGSPKQATAQVIALEAPTPLQGNQNDFAGDLGMDFVVNGYPIELDSLGFFDSAQDGILGSTATIVVEMWSRNDGGTPDDPADDTAGSLVASTSFVQGDDGVLNGASRFRSVTPTSLAPGSYTIVARGFGADDPLWNFGISGIESDLATVNGSGGILEFVGSSRFGTDDGFPPFFDAGPETRYHAGTFSYTVDIEPLVLEVNTGTGTARILNEGTDSFDVDTYEVQSDPNGPGSLDDSWAGLGGPWLKGGASDSFSLSEFNLSSSTSFGPGAMESIGGVFDTNSGAQDLAFSYVTTDGIKLAGEVRYVLGPAIDADFNGDGVVDSIDYAVWRESLGATGLSPYDQGDANGDGNVDSDDFQHWLSNYGLQTGGASGAPLATPEPGAAILLLSLGGVLCGRRSRRRCQFPKAGGAACCTVLLLGVLATTTSAAVTNDREYLFGDDNDEDAANAIGAVVGSGPGNVASGKTLDSSGPSGAFLDLTQNGDPVYVGVDAGGLNRPGAMAGDLGIRFLGTDDRLTGVALNRPDEMAGPSSVGPDSPVFADYPFNYDGITARGLQAWVYPDAAALGTGRQGVVFDSIAAGGIAITADGYWTQVNDGHATDEFPKLLQVVGDQWHHVMHHIYHSDDQGAPAVLAGTGAADLGFTGVLFVNGIAVAANNDNPAPGDRFAGGRTGALVVGAEEIADPGEVAVFDNHFQGVVDDLEMYVYGDNSELSGPPAGQDYGQFDLFEDNAWIANQISSTVPSGELKMGDINRDGDVNSADILAFVDGWLSQKIISGAHNDATVGDWETWGWGDLDHDGFVFMNDAYLLHEALLANGQGGLGLFGFPATAPEPGSLTILCLATLVAFRRHRAA